MRTKHTFRLPPDLADRLADYAARKNVAQALVVEAALASHLSPDGADRLEAALARRLDRMIRQIERLERHVTIANEALAIFMRFCWSALPLCPTRRCRLHGPRAESATKALSRHWAGGSRMDGRWPRKSCRTSTPADCSRPSQRRIPEAMPRRLPVFLR
jgi:hypothetical protein